MPLTLNNTDSLSNTYATIEYVDSQIVASGGVSQLDFDSSIATLQSKDVSYNNTLTSHISLIDTNTTDIATHTNDIAVLNTKQIQNFAGITDINTNLTNNYQTSSQLSSNFYNKTEIDTTLGNYYTSAQIDTTLGNYYTSAVIDAGFYNQTHVNNNIYTKTEVDTLIAGAGGNDGYTDGEIDSLLSLKEDKTTFTGNVSFFPVIDLSRPSILHQGLTIKNSTINVEPLEGILFSNQFGAETDRDVAVFKNQTNYITMKGNKINCNATSDDSIANLRLNPAGNIEFSNVILPAVGADLYRPSGNTSYNLRIRDLQGIWEFRNRTLTCRNASNENLDTLMEIQSLGQGQIRLGTASTAQVGIGANPNASYFLTVAGTSNFDVIRSATRLDLIGDMFVKGAGSDIVRPSATTDSTLRVRDNVGTFEFRNNKFGRTNGQMILQNDGDCELFVGTEGTARVGIGTAPNASYFLNVGGLSNFNEARIATNLEVLGEQLLNTDGRIFQRADAFNSLNVITTAQMNFSLQSDRTTDPTTGTIALQLDDTNGITINRAVVNNQTFNSIGNIVGEADVVSWGRFMFQNSSEFKEVLDTQYKLFIRNGDALGDINLMVGLETSTPEIRITNANVNLLGNLNITHSTVSTSERISYNIPDTNGVHIFALNGTNKFDIGETTANCYGNFWVGGDVSYTGSIGQVSDFNLKENIKELDTKKCLDVVKYIKAKSFNYKGKDKKRIGFVAQDWQHTKIPEEYDIAFKTDANEEYLKVDYSKTAVILYGAFQELVKEITQLKAEITKLKGKVMESDKSKKNE